MSGVRFTAWLSQDERGALRKLAAREGCSENLIVRMAMRALLFGTPVPNYLREQENETAGTTR